MVAHRRLGSAGQQHWPSVYSSLCSGCRRLAAAFSSEALKLPFCPSQPLCLWGGFPGYRNLSTFTAPFQGCRTHPDSFLTFSLFFFFPQTQLHGNFLVVWGFLPALSRYSVRIIPHVDVFLIYLWKKVGFISYSSAIFGALLMCLILKSIDWIMQIFLPNVGGPRAFSWRPN